MDTDAVEILANIPTWYTDLSNAQEEIVNNLHSYLRQDALELNSPRTCKFLDDLGIHPALSVVQITSCLERSHYRPTLFLKYVGQTLSRRQYDKLPGYEYTSNERLVYSAMCHLLYPSIIDKLSTLLPPMKKKTTDKIEDLRYIKLEPKKPTASPYLSVPEIFQKKRRIIVQHNKQVREKRKQYGDKLTKINYKQDIISEIVNNELVTNNKLKYQYEKSILKFKKLKDMFEILENERKYLYIKLYPHLIYKPKQLVCKSFDWFKEIGDDDHDDNDGDDDDDYDDDDHYERRIFESFVEGQNPSSGSIENKSTEVKFEKRPGHIIAQQNPSVSKENISTEVKFEKRPGHIIAQQNPSVSTENISTEVKFEKRSGNIIVQQNKQVRENKLTEKKFQKRPGVIIVQQNTQVREKSMKEKFQKRPGHIIVQNTQVREDKLRKIHPQSDDLLNFPTSDFFGSTTNSNDKSDESFETYSSKFSVTSNKNNNNNNKTNVIMMTWSDTEPSTPSPAHSLKSTLKSSFPTISTFSPSSINTDSKNSGPKSRRAQNHISSLKRRKKSTSESSEQMKRRNKIALERHGSLLLSMTDSMLVKELYNIDINDRLAIALKYLTIKNENLTPLHFLHELPQLKIWYQKRTPELFDKKIQFTISGTMKYDLEEILECMKETRIKLPKKSKVTKKDLEDVKASFTRELKLKQINLSRKLFTLYNVYSLSETDVKKFKRIFFPMFPNREKDIVIR